MHKAQADPKPGYNVQIGTENQFIVSYSISDKPNDLTSFIPHLKNVKSQFNKLPNTIVADAGYGSEENYEYLEDEKIDGVVKYPNWYREKKQKLSKFDKFLWDYDKDLNQYTCPNDRKLVFTHNSTDISSNGYKKQISHFKCESCVGCAFIDSCIKKYQKVNHDCRSISTSLRNDELTKKARESLSSEKGKRLRAKRSVEVETVFGNIKQNLMLRRFSHRGIEKVRTEWGLMSLAHNMIKIMTSGGLKFAI
jgi:hypothetical protein